MVSPSRKWRKWQSPDSTQGVRPRACTPSLCNPASRKAGKLLAPGGERHTLSTGPPSYCLAAAGAAQGVILAALWKDSDMGLPNSARTNVSRGGCWVRKDTLTQARSVGHLRGGGGDAGTGAALACSLTDALEIYMVYF